MQLPATIFKAMAVCATTAANVAVVVAMIIAPFLGFSASDESRTNAAVRRGAVCVRADAEPDEQEFRNPPPSARPHTWWHWMNGNVSKEGITADLEAMARVGIGGAQIFDAGLAIPKGPVEFASDAWFDCLVHADREAKRLGIELCIANCSGWTSSGGPWITPELSMKYVASTTVRVKGGERFSGRLPRPERTNGFYEDIAVLAFPEPANAKPALSDMPDFDLQVFRGRGKFGKRMLVDKPLMPLRVTEKFAPPESCVSRGEIIDLTSGMRPDGSLEWDDGKNSKGYPLVKAWPEWLLRGEPSPTGRHAFSTCRLWEANDPLLESGLLGPVRILMSPR